jgi:hypothetical protein
MKKRKHKKGIFKILLFFTILLSLIFILPRLLIHREEKPPSKPPVPPIKELKRPEIPEIPKPTIPVVPGPRIAIIIDDAGYTSCSFEKLMQFQGKLTFSVLPFLDGSSGLAEYLQKSGFEVILHIPMEPLDYPEKNPGEGALLMEDSREEIEKKTDAMIYNLKYIVGANNHMGSKLTQNYEQMTWIAARLKIHNLYFIDSLTTDNSEAWEAARDLGVMTARRDVFLDNEDNFSYINSQFERLKQIARKRGTAIGIGHAQSKNLPAVLNHQLPLLEEENIKLVFASEVVSN